MVIGTQKNVYSFLLKKSLKINFLLAETCNRKKSIYWTKKSIKYHFPFVISNGNYVFYDSDVFLPNTKVVLKP